MSEREIDWHEGMFLLPQHFQANRRREAEIHRRQGKCDHYFNWGVESIDLDETALANHRLVVRSLVARLRDGTVVTVPDDGVLPPLDLKGALAGVNGLTVQLGAPVLRMGGANVVPERKLGAARYFSETINVEDEDAGGNAQAVQVRHLNFQLLLSTEDATGFETVPIARIEKSARAEAVPQLDVNYFPPVLACDAWAPLQAGVLQTLYDRVGKKIDLLSEQVVSRSITLESQGQGDRTILFQLAALNEASTLLGVLAFTPGLHPLMVYMELCRLVGQLAIFDEARRPPPLPPYDHDDLGGRFYRVKQYLEGLLTAIVEPEYSERSFEGQGLRMQVSMEPAWLEPGWQMFVGVRSRLDAETCIGLLTRSGQLDMKIGSADRVDGLFRTGRQGLKFDYCLRPPRALPVQPGLIYFQISREAVEEEWENVRNSLTLAMRLNENLIVGNIQGQQVLNIRAGGQTTTLEFTLYVVPRR